MKPQQTARYRSPRTERKRGRKMGADDFSQMGVRITKALLVSVRRCYVSVCCHPVLVGVFLFLLFLRTSFPLVFSLLLSSSPVILCTAMLLGTLLSLGQPNVPEIVIVDKDNRTRETALLTTEGSASEHSATATAAAALTGKDESCAGESFTVNKRREDVADNVIQHLRSRDSDINLFNRNGSSNLDTQRSPSIHENSGDLQCGQQVAMDCRFEGEQKLGISEEGMRDQGLGVDDEEIQNQHLRVLQAGVENLEAEEHEKLLGEPVHDLAAEQLDSSPGLSKHEDSRGSSYSGSGYESESLGAESSSPDASMADIISMLDELHPLLNSEPPHPAQNDFNGGASELSRKSSNDDIGESDEDPKNQEEEEEDGDDNNDNDGDTQAVGDGKVSKSSISWTEDDQKNLMDLGASELERNQRLENLIARRRARKNMGKMAENNLIDFENTTLPFHVTPISTAKRNPFDLLYDSYDDTGLLAMPGSAPSVLLPKRNPFDIPYDSNEEKPDLTEDSFGVGFMPIHHKDIPFWRHESFNLGSTQLGFPKHVKEGLRFKSFLVPGRLSPAEASDPSSPRLSKEISDSPKNWSMGSTLGHEDKKIIEQDFAETEMVIEHVEHGSQSYKHFDSEDMGLNEAEMKLKVMEDPGGKASIYEGASSMDSSLSKTESMSMTMEFNEQNYYGKIGDVEVKCSTRSISSSLPEEKNERIDVTQAIESEATRPKNGVPFESGIFMQSPLNGSDFKLINSPIDASDVKDPDYDSCLSAVLKNLSSYSISSDLHVEVSETDPTSASVETTVSFADKETTAYEDKVEIDSCANGEILVASVVENASDDLSLSSSDIGLVEKLVVYVDQIVEKEGDQISSSIPVGENSLQDVTEKMDFMASGYKPRPSEGLTLSVSENPQPSLGFEQQLVVPPNSSSQLTKLVEKNLVDKEGSHHFERIQIDPFISDARIHVGVFQDWDEVLVSTGSNDQEVLSKQKSELEEQRTLSENFMIEPSFDFHGRSRLPSGILVDSIQGVNISLCTNGTEVVPPSEDKTMPRCSALAADQTSVIFKDSGNKLTHLLHLKGGILDGVGNVGRSQGIEDFHFSAYSSPSKVGEEQIAQMNHMDGLLSELDAIGDFSVNIKVPNVDEIGELDEDWESIAWSHEDPKLAKTRLELPVLEEKSIKDIDLAFKRLGGIDNEKSALLGSVDIKQVKDGSENLVETHLDLQVADARCPEDFKLASKGHSTGDLENMSKLLDSQDVAAEVGNETS